LIKQDKNKYNTPKYRFVVRFTNSDIICQIVAAKIVGDSVLTAAYAHELPRYGVKAGLTNYSAAYCVGLLTARRLLKKLGLDGKFKGKKEANGKFYLIRKLTFRQKKVLTRKGKKNIRNRHHPFIALLDVGLRKTSTGAKVFAALKGAVDGGLSIPHNPKRFVGFNKETQKLDPAVLRRRIFGGHVSDWMKKLKSEDEKKYNRQFSQYIKHGVTSETVESMYANAHKAIRSDPAHKKSEKPKVEKPKNYSRTKMSNSQRKDRIRQKMASFQKKITAKNN